MRAGKGESERLCEAKDAGWATGLWSRLERRTTAMFPVGRTLDALSGTMPGDIARWETWGAMREAMAAKGFGGTPYRMVCEYAAQYRGREAPAWFRAWRRFPQWMEGLELRTERPPHARLSFGFPTYGSGCSEECVQHGHVFLLAIDGDLHVAVVLRAGAACWRGLLQPSSSVRHHRRLALFARGGLTYLPVDAALVEGMVADGLMCLFRLDRDPLLEAAVSARHNASETLARVSRHFAFLLLNPEEPDHDRMRFALSWSVVFNPGKRKFDMSLRRRPRVCEVMTARGRPWMRRPIPVADASMAEAAAREAVLRDGYVQLPPGAPEGLVRAVTEALFFVTFPDRRPDEPGGILNGYQLPERVMLRASGPVRGANAAALAESRRADGERRIAARRALVVETLLSRASEAVARRNGLDAGEARARISAAGGAEALERAAWRLGMMEGDALLQFRGGPAGGALKLPGLSLAAAFEHVLGLDGALWRQAVRPAQTAHIAPLAETVGLARHTFAAEIPARRMWRGGVLRADYPPGGVRIIRDGGLWYALIVPRYARTYRLGRDLLPGPADADAVYVDAYRFVSGGSRSRGESRVEAERIDWGKAVRLAQSGRMALYSLDFGEWGWLAEAAYSASNAAPCRIVASAPALRERRTGGIVPGILPSDGWESSFSFSFTANPQRPRSGLAARARSWAAYLSAHPGDAARPRVEWPSCGGAGAADAMREVVKRDGVLIVAPGHEKEALAAAGYVTVPGKGAEEEGGAYRGYCLLDRVFLAPPAGWRGAPGRRCGEPRTVAGSVSAEAAARLEREFAALVEGDPVCGGRAVPGAPEEFAPLVRREFGRILRTGTMSLGRQLVRPAHEVALALFLISLTRQD